MSSAPKAGAPMGSFKAAALRRPRPSLAEGSLERTRLRPRHSNGGLGCILFRGAGSDPFHLFFDWDATLFASHGALMGRAAGGSEVEVTWYECSPFISNFCFPIPTFQQKRVFTGSVVAGEQWDLGLFNQSDPYGMLHVTFDVGSIASTYPVIGVYASAIDIGTFDFTLRADDGRAQPVPSRRLRCRSRRFSR